MALVLDVSVAVRWFLADERDSSAQAVLERVCAEGALVPALFRREVQSALLSAERAQRIASEDVDDALEALRDLPITIELPGERIFVGAELQLARYYELTPYDAAYLALAASRGLALASFDAALLRAAQHIGLQLLP